MDQNKNKPNHSDIKQQPPFGDHKYCNTLPQMRGGGVWNILTFYSEYICAPDGRFGKIIAYL